MSRAAAMVAHPYPEAGAGIEDEDTAPSTLRCPDSAPVTDRRPAVDVCRSAMDQALADYMKDW